MRTLLIAVPLMDRIGDGLYPIAMDRIRTSPPLGIYWLAGLLRASGHEVGVLDLIASGTLERTRILSEVSSADLVGISANSLNWPTARLVVEWIKAEHPSLPIVLGGIHPSQYPEHVLTVCPADFILRGEGERGLLALVRTLDRGGPLDDVPGLCRRRNGRTLIGDVVGMLAQDALEALPDPAYDLLPAGVYETLSVESARGCRFSCAFCSTKLRGRWRGVRADSFVSRIERLMPYLEKTKYGIFSFVDDLYTLDIARVAEISSLLTARGLGIRATLDARATDIVRGNVPEALVPITNHMLIGAECGYDEGLRRIRKCSTTAVLERAAAAVQRVGLAPVTVFSFVIGFPFETRDDCLRTVAFASNLMGRYGVRIYLQWFNTIPGSDLWDELVAQGKIDIGMYDHFGFFVDRHLFLAGVHLSVAEIQEISEIVGTLNKVMVLANRNLDVMQFSAPEWLWSEPTRAFPSHGHFVAH